MNKWRKPWPSWVWDWIAGHILNPKPTTAQRKRKSIWVYVWRKWEDLGFCAATVRVGYKGGTNHEANRLCVCFLFFVFFFFFVSEVKSLFGLKMKPRPLCSVFKNRNHTHTQHNTSTHTTTTKTQISVYLSLRCLQAPSLSSRILIAFQARNLHLPIRTQKGQAIYFVTSAHQNLISLWETTLYYFTFDNVMDPFLY